MVLKQLYNGFPLICLFNLMVAVDKRNKGVATQLVKKIVDSLGSDHPILAQADNEDTFTIINSCN